MTRTKKRTVIGLFFATVCLCALSLFVGLLPEKYSVAAESAAVVYDVSEVGGEKSGAGGTTTNLASLPNAVDSTSAVGIKCDLSVTIGPNKGIKIGAFRTEKANAWASGGQMVQIFCRYANDTWDYWLEICDPSNVDSVIARTGLGIGVSDLSELVTIEGEMSIVLENGALSLTLIKEGTPYTASTTTVASTWGQYFPTYADANTSFTAKTTVETGDVTITDIEDLTGGAVSTGEKGSAICSLGTDTVKNVGVKFTYTPSGSGQVKLGAFKSEENNVWAGAGYILWFSDIASQQFNLLGCVDGNSEKNLNLNNISVADELADGKAVFEISVTSTGVSYTLRIVVDGTEKVTYSTTESDIPLGKYFNIYNEGSATGVFSTTNSYTYDEVAGIYDVSVINNASATEIAGANAGTTYIGGLGETKTNVGVTYKLSTPAQSGIVKLGLFKAAGTNVWGGSTDGYILQYYAGTSMVRLCDGNNDNLTDKIALSSALEHTVEVYNVTRYNNGVADGYHKLVVKIDGVEVISYQSNSIVLGGEFNGYGDGTEYTVLTTVEAPKNAFDLNVTVNGSGSVTGNVGLYEGDTAVLTIAAAEGYELSSVTVDGVDVTENVVDGQLTIENVTKETAVTVEFISLFTYDTISNAVDLAELIGQASIDGKMGATTRLDEVENSVNKQITYKLIPYGESGLIKLGFFKSELTNVWGGETDGYILQYNVATAVFQLFNGDNVAVTAEVGVESVAEYSIAVYNVARYNDGVADGYHKIGVIVNGEEILSYESNAIVLGNAFNGYGDEATYKLSTTKSTFILDVEKIGEGSVEGVEVVEGFETKLVITPAEGYYLQSVTLDGTDIMDSLTANSSENGTYYEYVLENATNATVLKVTFAEAGYTYGEATVADFAEVVGVTSVFGGDKHTAVGQINATKNVGVKFNLNAYDNIGIYKIGLFNVNADSVWANGYVLKVNKKETGVRVQLIDAMNDFNGAYVCDYAEEIPVDGYITVEVAVEERLLNGDAAGHRIRVWVCGVEALVYETDVIELGNYFNIYNEAGGLFELFTAKEYETVDVFTEGEGKVLGGKVVEGYATTLAVIPKSGYYVATFKWNLQSVVGTEGYTVKEGFYEYIASQPSAGDVVEIEFIEAATGTATVYDIYEYTKVLSMVWGDGTATDAEGTNSEIAANGIFMETPTNGNDAVSLKIKLNDEFSGRLRIGAFKNITSNTIWDKGGFIFEVRNMGEDKAIYMLGINGGENFAGKYASEEWTQGGAEFTVELGIVQYLGNGEQIGNYYYVKINGEEIISYIDYTCIPYGPRMMLPYLEDEKATFTLSSPYDYFTVTSNQAEGLVQQADYVFKAGQPAAISIPLASGYDVTLVKANGVDVTALLEKVGGGYIYRVEAISEHIVLDIVTAKSACNVNVEAAEHLQITSDKTAVDYNGSVVFTIVPEVGYVVSGATFGGVDVTDKLVYASGAYTYTAYAVTVDASFTATATAKTYAVSVNAGDGGKAEVSKAEVGAFGETVLTVTVNDGYQIASITVNGKSISVNAEGKYTFTCVEENLEIKVSFEKTKAIPDEKEPVQEPDSSEEQLFGGCGSAIAGLTAMPLLASATVALMKKKRKTFQEENV